MTIGAMWSGLMVFFFLKTIKKQYKKIENKDPDWMKILTGAAFFGVICVFLARPVTAGGVPLFTVISGAVLMTICALLITKRDIKWLKEFALPISMIGAMASAVIFTRILA
jgi:asparagine N-glycosylation enzyme membrane subunit Stt3